jgi:hypothetical protein
VGELSGAGAVGTVHVQSLILKTTLSIWDAVLKVPCPLFVTLPSRYRAHTNFSSR